MSDQDKSSRPRRRFISKPKFCQFCADKTIDIDYKNTDLLRRFVTEDGKIRPRRQTGTCAKHQRTLAREVKKARHIALLPFTGENWKEVLRQHKS